MKKPLQFPVTAVFILCPVVTFEMHHLKQGKMANGNIARCFHSCDELRSEGYLSLTSTLASSRPTASICLTPGSPVSTLRLKLVILSKI